MCSIWTVNLIQFQPLSNTSALSDKQSGNTLGAYFWILLLYYAIIILYMSNIIISPLNQVTASL